MNLINNLIKLFVPKYNTAIKSNSKEKFDGLLTFVYRSLYVNRLSLVKYLWYEPINKLYKDTYI